MSVLGTSNYEELRSAYDLAFRQLARELQQVNRLQLHDSENNSLVAAQQRLTGAQSAYLQARNALASYLLVRQPANRPSRPAPKPKRSVEELAYFFWEKDGKPSGNDQAYWFRAEATYPLVSSLAAVAY